MTRGTIIAALVVVELAIVGEAVVAVGGGKSPNPAIAFAGPRVREDGPHRLFAAGAHPELTVAVGYADLTIRTGTAPTIDVSVRSSSDFGLFRSHAAILASADGDAVHITKPGDDMSSGDDRMVTVVVPPGTRVEVANAGNVTASGLRAEATFSSVGDGSVTIEDFAGPTLRVASHDGPISLSGVAAEHLEVDGHDKVEGSALRVRDGSISADDRVVLGFAPGSDTLVSADARDGKIDAPGVPQAALSGNVVDDDASLLTVRLGAGSGHLDVKSDDGNITLAQEG
jgi:hypothetical protein